MPAPLPTLGVRRRDQRLGEVLEEAKEQLAVGEKVAAWLTILTAVEVAYGFGEVPAELTQLLDELNACRDYFR